MVKPTHSIVHKIEELLAILQNTKMNNSKKLRFDYNLFNAAIDHLANAYPEFNYNQFKINMEKRVEDDEETIKGPIIRIDPNTQELLSQIIFENPFKLRIFDNILKEIEDTPCEDKESDMARMVELDFIRMIFDTVKYEHSLKKDISEFCRAVIPKDAAMDNKTKIYYKNIENLEKDKDDLTEEKLAYILYILNAFLRKTISVMIEKKKVRKIPSFVK